MCYNQNRKMKLLPIYERHNCSLYSKLLKDFFAVPNLEGNVNVKTLRTYELERKRARN